MSALLLSAYPWIKSLHVISVIAWMAGLFYLPRLFVYHTESALPEGEAERLFITMEARLLRVIMNPAMIASWLFGVLLVITPGVVDWGQVWPWAKMAGILAMTAFHMWLARCRRDLATGRNTITGRQYRMMNEIPTVLMIVIVVSVIARPF